MDDLYSGGIYGDRASTDAASSAPSPRAPAPLAPAPSLVKPGQTWEGSARYDQAGRSNPGARPAAQLPGAIAKSSGPTLVVKESTPAADDTDTATRQTVAKMCEYIAAGASDELVKWWGECGVTRYGLGNRDPQAMCWATYWLVKHAIQFARDEPRLFRVGEPDALDMLIAPAVLVRMAQPKEDCDGFTMLICALLRTLGIESVIVTVAADPADPERWSHVFPIAILPSGTLCPLDASHGTWPGWMVPREHIFRWQAWTLDAKPVDVPIPPKRGAGLHGYVRRGRRMPRRGVSGLGQCTDDVGDPITCSSIGEGCYDVNGNPIACGSSAPGTTIINPTSPLPESPIPVSVPAPAGTSPSTPINWATIISQAIGSAAKVAQTATLPAGSYITTNPITGAQTVVTGGGSTSAASILSSITGSSMLPILLIAGVLILLISSMEKK